MRAITINGILQIAAVLMSFFALRLIVRPSIIDAQPAGIHFNPYSVFLTTYGLLLLFFPFCWAIYAAIAERTEHGILSSKVAHVIGVTFSAVTIVAFLYALSFPFTTGMIISK